MTAPTEKQVMFYNDLIKNAQVMAALTDDQRVIVKRAGKPGVTLSQMSMALNILRTHRDSLKGATREGGAQVEGTPTPVNTFTTRLEVYASALKSFREVDEITREVLVTVEQPSPPGACLNCGHDHEGKMLCVAPGETKVDPRYTGMPITQQTTYSALGGGVPMTTPEPCGCTSYAEPDISEVMAWQSMVQSRAWATKVNKAWQDAREFKPGDPMVITGKTKQNYPTGTRGTYIRMWQGTKGVAIVFRTTDLKVTQGPEGPVYTLARGSSEMDVWVREGALSRLGEDNLPETLPEDVILALPNSKA